MLEPLPLVAPSADDATSGLDRLEEQFERCAAAFRRQVRARSAEIDPALPPAGYRTLRALAVLGPTNPSLLAETLGFDRSVLSRQLHQLGELGLVTRAQDPHDRRAAVVEVTPVAAARLARIREVEREEFRRRLADWAPGELEQLTRLLARLREEYVD